MRDALMNEAVWMRTRLEPCPLKVRAVCYFGVQLASSRRRKRSSFGPHDHQKSMIMRHQEAFASELGQLASAFDKKTLDPKNAFPIGMAAREIVVILNDTGSQRIDGPLSIHRAS